MRWEEGELRARVVAVEAEREGLQGELGRQKEAWEARARKWREVEGRLRRNRASRV